MSERNRDLQAADERILRLERDLKRYKMVEDTYGISITEMELIYARQRAGWLQKVLNSATGAASRSEKKAKRER